MAAPTDKSANAALDEDTNDQLYPGVEDQDEPDDDGSDDGVEEQEDGTAIVHDKAAQDPELGAGTSEFYDNLAESLEDSELDAITIELVDLIERDKEAQNKRDKLYADGLKQTGLSGDAPGGADFPGASRATHPMILEAAIDSAAQIYKELHPADGPCRIKIVGDKPDEKLLDRAERVKSYMNYQLTDEIEEYEEELDQCISQVPLAGSQFMKLWWDAALDRPATEYIPQDKFYLPYSEASFYSAKRKTHEFTVSQVEYDRRVDAGIYKDAPYSLPSMGEQSLAEKQIDKQQGDSADPTGDDQPLALYESYVWLDILGDDEADEKIAPYIVTIREQDNVCVALRRNWEQSKEPRRAMDWVIEYPYIRWRGSLTLGLMSVIGGLSKASTGALRALLDSAFVNNSPSLMKMKGARFTGQTQQVSPVGINEVEASPGIKDIRQLLMAFPYNPPSMVLYELLGFLVTAGKGVVSTAEEKIADASNQMPMGTALALIEQGGKVFSSIHKRQHKAQKRFLKALYRINRMYLTKERVIEELGELTVKPEDFSGPCPIIPVSDPNIFSDAQRFAQIQAVLMLAQGAPQLYDLREIHERALQLLKFPDPEGVMVPDKQPQDLNPVAENMAMAMGGKATAFPLQDHLAHLQSHMTFYQDPSFGQNPIITPAFVGNFVEHCKQHLIQQYAKMCYDAATAAAGQPIEKLMKNDPAHRAELDKLLAIVGVHVMQQSQAVFAKMLPILAQAQQQAKQFQPPAPMDPTAVQAQAVQVEAQRAQSDATNQQQANQAKVIDIQTRKELDTQQMQQEAAAAAAKRQSDLRKEAIAQEAESQRRQQQSMADAEIAAEANRVKEQDIAAANMRNEQDNQTAISIAAARAMQGKVGGETSGKSLTNPEP